MLILSLGFYACLEKGRLSTRLSKTYLSHEKAHRDILNTYQSEVYKRLWRKSGSHALQENNPAQEISSPPTTKPQPPINRQCAKINLYPLVQEGRENHPILYELAARALRTFYAPLAKKQARFEYLLLDELLATARQFPPDRTFAFEKLELPHHQRLYYKMLKGTKQWNITTHLGLPPLLDYFKIAHEKDRICLCHAHPDLLTVLFGASVANTLYPEIHQKKGPALTRELVETHFHNARLFPPDPALLDLLEYGHHRHTEVKKMLVGTDQDLSLRQPVYLKAENSN